MYYSMDFSQDYLGFIGDVELLPKDFDQFNSQRKLRQLFLSLANNTFKEFCCFKKAERINLSKHSLKEAFRFKIKSMLPSNIKISNTTTKSFNFCKESTLVINAYKNNKSVLINKDRCELKVAKLILTVFAQGNFQILLDKNLLFHEFVLKRIRNLHKTKTVTDHGDSISITGEDVSSLKIYTFWKNIETRKPNIQEELEYAINSIKNDGYKQVYLVYPKDGDFKRHIPVYVDELKKDTYKIKAIPYSLRSTLRDNNI